MTVTSEPLTSLVRRPRYEGANIGTWIGFKHFLYLVEEAVLEHLIESGTGARALFREHGLGAEIVECSVLLPAVLEVDDQVSAQVTPGPGDRLNVRLVTRRDGEEVVALRGKVRLALVPERLAAVHESAPDPLQRYECSSLEAAAGAGRKDIALGGVPAVQALSPEDGLLWSWRVPYFYCHFSDRMQASGYVRALEEGVDRLLAHQGISVGRMLQERTWIPVVSRVRFTQFAPVHMEEVLHCALRVEDVLRATMFDVRMDCYVERDGIAVHVATGTILHGYAISGGERAGQVATLDDGVVAALTGRAR